MKRLVLALSLVALTITAKAQTTTNIAYRITVETVTAGVTNSANTSFRFDYGVKREAAYIDGYSLALKNTTGATDLGAWLKQDIKDRAKNYADAKAALDNTALAAKIQSLLLSNPDLLSASDLSTLSTIAAKAP